MNNGDIHSDDAWATVASAKSLPAFPLPRRPRASPGTRGALSIAEITTQGGLMSVKKEASGRRAVQVKAEVPGSAQSAVVRRAAEAQLRTLIAKFAPAHLRLIGAMRRWLRK